MVERILFGPGGSSEAKQNQILTSLSNLLSELQQKLEPGQEVALNAATLAALETINSVVSGTVALDAPTLSALEQITATISNWPADYPDAAALSKLEQIRVLLAAGIPVSGEVSLSAATLAALENITVAIQAGQIVGLDSTTLAALENIAVTGTVALDAPTLAALENITAVVSGTVALDSTTLAALESITATVSGSVSVTNFPVEYPLPGSQITTLTPQLDGLTDAELRASPVPVSGTFTPSGPIALDAPTLAALETITVLIQSGQLVGLDATTLAALESITVSGTVALDAPTLAALENITAIVDGPIALDATTLAALESITATISGSVAVTGPLTDAQLRATPVPISGTVSVNEPVTVDGVVALDATTLAALETITILVQSGQVIGLDAATLAALESITVSGTVALDAPTLAALENITAVVSGTVALDGPTLAALESITATISGSVAVTGPLTDAEMRAADVNVADSGEREYIHVVSTVTAVGDTTIYTPAAGKAIRLHWIYTIGDPASTNPPLINIKIGSLNLFRVYALSKRQRKTGAIDAPLIINLNQSGSVAVTAILEEV